MKKKIGLIVAITIVSVCTLFSMTACNMDVIDLNYKYDKVHLYETGKCYEVAGWTDYEDGEQLQVRLKNGGTILVNSVSCMLINGKCPICNE